MCTVEPEHKLNLFRQGCVQNKSRWKNHIKLNEFGIKGKSFLAYFLYSILELHKINFRITLLTCVNRDHLCVLRKTGLLHCFLPSGVTILSPHTTSNSRRISHSKANYRVSLNDLGRNFCVLILLVGIYVVQNCFI